MTYTPIIDIDECLQYEILSFKNREDNLRDAFEKSRKFINVNAKVCITRFLNNIAYI